MGAGCSGLYQFKEQEGFSNSPEQAKRMTELCQKMVTWNASRIEAELRSKEEAQREASRRASGSRKNPRASTVGSSGPRKRKVL